MSMSAVGIPYASLALANSITLPGYARAIADNNRRRGRRLGNANAAFQLMLNRNVFDASSIPMHRNMAAVLYKVPGLHGLGDDLNLDFLTDPSNPQTAALLDSINNGDFSEAPDVAPPVQDQNGSPGIWGDILKAFAGPLAMGVGGRIAGVNPWAKPAVSPVAAMSTTTKVVIAGGALLVGAFVVSKLASKKS